MSTNNPKDPIRMRFAPGVVFALLSTREQEARARIFYPFWLGEMDVAQAALAHKLLAEKGIDHASPAGYVCFKTAAEQLDAMKLLSELDPASFGWRWRIPLGRSDLSMDAWIEAMLRQPFQERYLQEK